MKQFALARYFSTSLVLPVNITAEESSFALKGSWVNTDIPNSISFDLKFADGSKLACFAEKKTPEFIQCPNAKGNINSTVIDQYIDIMQWN